MKLCHISSHCHNVATADTCALLVTASTGVQWGQGLTVRALKLFPLTSIKNPCWASFRQSPTLFLLLYDFSHVLAKSCASLNSMVGHLYLCCSQLRAQVCNFYSYMWAFWIIRCDCFCIFYTDLPLLLSGLPLLLLLSTLHFFATSDEAVILHCVWIFSLKKSRAFTLMPGESDLPLQRTGWKAQVGTGGGYHGDGREEHVLLRVSARNGRARACVCMCGKENLLMLLLNVTNS